MKPCERIVDLFQELHDTRLGEESDGSAREHLMHCPVCREEFKWYGLTVQALANLERVTPPAHFTAQLRAKLYSAETSHSFFDSFKQMFTSFPYLPLPVGVTALAFVAAVAFVMYEHTPVNMMRPDGPPTPVRVASSGISQAAEMPLQKAPGVAEAMRPKGAEMAETPAPTAPSTAEAKAASPEKELRVARTPASPFSGPPAERDALTLMAPTFGSLPVPKSAFGAGMTASARARGIGTDSLTVESDRVDQAVDSVLRLLPDLRGKVVEQRARGLLGERILSVVIPPEAFGSLATELVNHGIVEAGPPEERNLTTATETNGQNVVLTIRFVRRP